MPISWGGLGGQLIGIYMAVPWSVWDMLIKEQQSGHRKEFTTGSVGLSCSFGRTLAQHPGI